MKTTTVLFDLDGTLTDSQRGITLTIQQVLAALGRTGYSQEDLLWCVGPQLRDCFLEMLGHDEALANEAMRLYSRLFEGGNMFINRLYPGVLEMLSALRAIGLRLAVVSGKPVWHSTPVLEHFGMMPYLCGVFGPTRKNASEDKGWLIHEAMRRLGVSPRECVYVGDRRGDILGARANGVEMIAASYGYGSPEEQKTAGATRFASSPAEIASVVVAL